MEIIIQDDFFEDPETLRFLALKECTFQGQDFEGHFYPGVDAGCPIDAYDELEYAMEREVEPKLAFWRLSKPGEDTPAPIHADSICAKWAGLLYMTPTEEFGGTAFWRHKELGHQSIPTKVKMRRDQSYFDKINEDSGNEDAWDMTMLVLARFNRFVAFPTQYYHSRYPFYSDNYGDTTETARLIWVVFFD